MYRTQLVDKRLVPSRRGVSRHEAVECHPGTRADREPASREFVEGVVIDVILGIGFRVALSCEIVFAGASRRRRIGLYRAEVAKPRRNCTEHDLNVGRTSADRRAPVVISRVARIPTNSVPIRSSHRMDSDSSSAGSELLPSLATFQLETGSKMSVSSSS